MADSETFSSSSLVTEGPGAFTNDPQGQSPRSSTGPNVRLPPFSTKNPSSWFHRAEANFRIARLTDQLTKADIVLSSLPEEAFVKLTPWLDSRDGPIEYGELKTKIMATYSLPVAVRAQRALDLMSAPLGDQTPTDAWDELQGLVQLPGVDIDGRRREISLTKEIFLRRLPQGIRAQLTEADALPIPELVEKAQHLFEAAKASVHAAAAAACAVETAPNDEEAIEEEEDKTICHVKPKPYFKQKKPPPKNSSWSQERSHPTWCFYHNNFGEKAFKCRAGCRYPKN